MSAKHPATAAADEFEEIDLTPHEAARLRAAYEHVDRGLPCKPLDQAMAEIRARLLAAAPTRA